MKFDAIVCDPPYGVRAGARKIGTTRREVKSIPTELLDNHIPATTVYEVEEVVFPFISAICIKAKCRKSQNVGFFKPTLETMISRRHNRLFHLIPHQSSRSCTI